MPINYNKTEKVQISFKCVQQTVVLKFLKVNLYSKAKNNLSIKNKCFRICKTDQAMQKDHFLTHYPTYRILFCAYAFFTSLWMILALHFHWSASATSCIPMLHSFTFPWIIADSHEDCKHFLSTFLDPSYILSFFFHIYIYILKMEF